MPVPIPLSKPDITRREIDAVVDVMHTDTLSIGPKAVEFERLCAELAGRRQGVAVSSGTAGLHCAMIAAGIREGDEVITAPFAIVGVEVFGHPGGMPELEQIAQKHELALIEDACEGFGGRAGRRAIGSFGR